MLPLELADKDEDKAYEKKNKLFQSPTWFKQK